MRPDGHWKIFYADREPISSSDCRPADAFPLGVIVLAVQDEASNGRQLLHGFDWYWWIPGDGFCGGDLHGMHDQVMFCGATAVKMGRTIPTDLFRAIYHEADQDPETRAWLS